MSRYLDPKADVVFKKVFGEHPHLLMSFLNAVLPLREDHSIVTLTYLNTENTPMRSLWLRFLREVNEQTKEISPELLAIPEIKEAIDLVQESAFSEGELQAYDSYWDAVSVEKTLKSASYQEGLAEGLAAGEAKLRAEKKAIAQKLLAQGLSKEAISEITGSTPEEF